MSKFEVVADPDNYCSGYVVVRHVNSGHGNELCLKESDLYSLYDAVRQAMGMTPAIPAPELDNVSKLMEREVTRDLWKVGVQGEPGEGTFDASPLIVALPGEVTFTNPTHDTVTALEKRVAEAERRVAELERRTAVRPLFSEEDFRVGTVIAQHHYRADPGITQVWMYMKVGDTSADPIKLLIVNEDTVPGGIMPLNFAADPTRGTPRPLTIIEVTPDEHDSIRTGKLKLPPAWQFGTPLSKPAASSVAVFVPSKSGFFVCWHCAKPIETCKCVNLPTPV